MDIIIHKFIDWNAKTLKTMDFPLLDIEAFWTRNVDEYYIDYIA
jgi:hypothetical protein